MGELITDGRTVPVSGKDRRVIGKLCQFPQAVYYHEHRATQIGPAYAALEERVAGECHLLFLAVERYSTGRMARSRNDAELVVAK